jgi:hypothetical protein
MRGQADTIRAKLSGRIVRDMTNEANNKKDDSSGEQRGVGVKKPYKAPSFRFESVFEVSALSCGKVSETQGSCRASRKAS